MWSEGTLGCPTTNKIYKYWVKVFDEPSAEFGLNGGRISKVTIRLLNSDVDLYSYERGECTPCADEEIESVLRVLLQKYS